TSILRGQAPTGETQPRPEERDTPAGQADFVGRDEEVGRLTGAWAEALAGRPALVVIAGEAGMGKTALAGRLAQMVERTGGMVAMARCYQAERSLFLQPVADALRSALSFTPPEVLRDAAGEWSGTLADLVPDLGPILRPFARGPSAPDIQRRRTFEAVTAFLRGVQRRQP